MQNCCCKPGRAQRRLSFTMLAVSTLLAALMLTTSVQGVQIIAGTPSTFTTIYSQQHLVVALHDKASMMARTTGIKIKPGSAARPMTDKDGKQWTCYLPPKQPHHEQHKQLTTTPPEDLIPKEVKTPFELLERLSTLCLYRQEGLWTYEMCYKKQTRQFRQGSGEIKGEDFSCGTYTGDDNQVEEIKVDNASPADARLRYVSHLFTGGAPCALTGSGRTTEVRFTCQKGVHDNVIVSVREFPTCNYVFTVSTPFLCKHPQFKPPEEVLRTINCIPALRPGKEEAHKHHQEQTHIHKPDAHHKEAAGDREGAGEAAGKTDTTEATLQPGTLEDGAQPTHTQEQVLQEAVTPGESTTTTDLPGTKAEYPGSAQTHVPTAAPGDTEEQFTEEVHGHVTEEALQRAREEAQKYQNSQPAPEVAPEGDQQPLTEEVHGHVSEEALQLAREEARRYQSGEQAFRALPDGNEQQLLEEMHGDVSEEAMQRARDEAHLMATRMAEERAAAAQAPAGEAAAGGTVVQQHTSTISIAVDCDIPPEGEVAHPACRITGLSKEQSRIIQEQVAFNTHRDGRSPEYQTVYEQARDEAYAQVLEQVRVQGISDERAYAHARHQAAVHAHATALAHVHALEGLVLRRDQPTVEAPQHAEHGADQAPTPPAQTPHTNEATQPPVQHTPAAHPTQHAELRQPEEPAHPTEAAAQGQTEGASQGTWHGDVWDIQVENGEAEYEDFATEDGVEPDDDKFQHDDGDHHEDDSQHDADNHHDEL